MGPRNAATRFLAENPNAAGFRVTLFGSLAATGKGHLTDKVLTEVLGTGVQIVWKPEVRLPYHPNGMEFEALDAAGALLRSWKAYSVGGGAIADDTTINKDVNLYEFGSMQEALEISRSSGKPLWELVTDREGEDIWDFLAEVWKTMRECILRGINTEGVLPGSLHLGRKAADYHARAKLSSAHLRRAVLLFSYALAVSEENAAGGVVVTAPTCGSCGTLPAVLMYLKKAHEHTDREILCALATAGLVGNIVKHNGSISGAEVGCQGEVGTACAMASAAAAQLLGAAPRQIEYAAEMGIEHHLGLTCDPVAGLVQIPCIERNAFAATRALDSAQYAILSDGSHRISFDDVVATMKRTGLDMNSRYRETSTGGLASIEIKNVQASRNERW
jgi:L-serine dehydratase